MRAITFSYMFAILVGAVCFEVNCELGNSYFLILLNEAYAQVGQLEEGLTALNEAFTFVDKTGERAHESELHRLKGELLLSQSSDNQTEAETCFLTALSIARQQQAKSLELRAAISFARLWREQDKRQEARQLLGDVYNWFTEGFDTADLRDAKALLAKLGE